MKTRTFFKQSILLITVGFSTVLANAQAILTVDNNPGTTAAYTDVQAAHDAAAAGDLIYIQASLTSYGSLIITKPISLVGRSHSESFKISTVDDISIASSDVTIKGLNISSIASATGGTVPYANLEIYENKVAGDFTLGNDVDNSTDTVLIQGNQLSDFTQGLRATNVLVVNNIFIGSFPLSIYNAVSIVVANNIFKVPDPVYFDSYSAGTINLSNNMFLTNRGSDANIRIRGGAFFLSNNLFYNYNTAFSVNLVESGGGSYTEINSLFDADPQFTSVDVTNPQSMAGTSAINLNFANNNDDLTLQVSSPAIDGGTGGSEIGIFNIFNYKYYGKPRDIPVLDITTYDANVPKNGTINLTINAKAH